MNVKALYSFVIATLYVVMFRNTTKWVVHRLYSSPYTPSVGSLILKDKKRVVSLPSLLPETNSLYLDVTRHPVDF